MIDSSGNPFRITLVLCVTTGTEYTAEGRKRDETFLLAKYKLNSM